jgi:hypothetical protein
MNSITARNGDNALLRDDPLCRACQLVNLPRIFGLDRYDGWHWLNHHEETPDKLDQVRKLLIERTGLVSQLASDARCRLCKILMEVHLREHPNCVGDDESCYLLPLTSDRIPSRNADGEIDVETFQYIEANSTDSEGSKLQRRLATSVYPLFLSEHMLRTRSWNIPEASSLGLYRFKLEASSASPERTFHNHAGFTDNKVNWEALRSYLRGCEETHRECSLDIDNRFTSSEGDWDALRRRLRAGEGNHESWADGTGNPDTYASSELPVRKTYPIRCLDIRSMNLVTLDLRDRYIVLSYVWGGHLDPETQWPALFLSSGEVRKAALPRTIRDAIIATEMLGERYLWVDLVCINQNDPEDFKTQISQMNIIYKNAVCTIVALYGVNAEAGLPGVSDASRSRTESLVKINAKNIVCGPHIDFLSAIKSSRWRERAWTFQEEQSSRRCLCFGDHEVLFWCFSCNGRETLGWVPQWRNLQLREKSFAEVERESRLNGIDHWEFNLYQGAVSEYTSRKLTYDSDVLNAFAGALNNLEYQRGKSFVCGLPKEDLLNALMWAPTPWASHLSRRRLFPSWTWLEWSGSAIYYPYYSLIWALNKADGSLCAPGGKVFARGLVDTGDGFWAPRAAVVDSTKSDNQLCITSEIRCFYVVSRSSPIGPPAGATRSDCMLIGIDGEPISDPAETAFQSREDVLFPFLVGDVLQQLPQPAEFVFLARWEGDGRTPSFSRFDVHRVFAMLIHRRESGLAERVAMVDLPAKAWDAAPMTEEWTQVILV